MTGAKRQAAEGSINAVQIEELVIPAAVDDLDWLTDLTLDAVASGASVSFMRDSTFAQIRSFWERTTRSLTGAGRVLVVRDGSGIIGTVSLLPAWAPNQPHRAELAKLLVHRRARRHGIGQSLMEAAEERARAAGFTLLTLDTVPGDPGDRLYRRIGWVPAGIIPGFALYPDGAICDTVLFYKVIA